MSVSTKDIAHIAQLARLALEPHELERMRTQLNSILEHMQELREVDLTDVEPFALAAESVAPPRSDEPGADTLHAPVAELAVSWRDGFFTVPRLDAQRDTSVTE